MLPAGFSCVAVPALASRGHASTVRHDQCGATFRVTARVVQGPRFECPQCAKVRIALARAQHKLEKQARITVHVGDERHLPLPSGRPRPAPRPSTPVRGITLAQIRREQKERRNREALAAARRPNPPPAPEASPPRPNPRQAAAPRQLPVLPDGFRYSIQSGRDAVIVHAHCGVASSSFSEARKGCPACRDTEARQARIERRLADSRKAWAALKPLEASARRDTAAYTHAELQRSFPESSAQERSWSTGADWANSDAIYRRRALEASGTASLAHLVEIETELQERWRQEGYDELSRLAQEFPDVRNLAPGTFRLTPVLRLNQRWRKEWGPIPLEGERPWNPPDPGEGALPDRRKTVTLRSK